MPKLFRPAVRHKYFIHVSIQKPSALDERSLGKSKNIYTPERINDGNWTMYTIIISTCMQHTVGLALTSALFIRFQQYVEDQKPIKKDRINAGKALVTPAYVFGFERWCQRKVEERRVLGQCIPGQPIQLRFQLRKHFAENLFQVQSSAASLKWPNGHPLERTTRLHWQYERKRVLPDRVA